MRVNDLLLKIRARSWRLKHLHAGLDEIENLDFDIDPDLYCELLEDLREEIFFESRDLAYLFAEAESLGLMAALAEHAARHIAVEAA